MKTKTRYLDIDFIRAVGTIGIIVTHILALHLGSSNINIFWNYLHFVVVGFIFCSSYVYASANPISTPQQSWIANFAKRFQRLYMPFVLYLIAHYTLWFFFPTWFTGFGLTRSTNFIIASFTLTGGADIGWLPLLFIQLALLAPLLLYGARHPRIRNLLLIFLAIFTLVTTFWRIPASYSRAVGWIPWLFIVLLSYMYSDIKNNIVLTNRVIKYIVTAGILTWLILYGALSHLGQSLTLTIHKYPPDLFYFSYGISATAILLLLFEKNKMLLSPVTKLVLLISKRSYMIFFVHFIFIDMITTSAHWTWWQESIVITLLSLGTVYIWEIMQTKKLFWQTHNPHFRSGH